MVTTRAWQEAAAEAQKHRDGTIARASAGMASISTESRGNVTSIPRELLSPREVQLTETPVENLAESLASGKISCVDTVKAFLKRAAIAQQLTNCLTELLPERALDRAKALDAHLEEHKKPVGPLHGVPISVKEHFAMRDLELNAGFCSWYGKIAPEDALIVKILWDAGAVFYARTTEPQTLMHLECSSNLYGVTVNPFNRSLTSGGSTGGEGALLGLRGSCLGVGTDIGGSVRSPAANCGVYALRPTSYRLPVGGAAATMLGQEHIVSCAGPMSTSLGGLKLLMKTVIDSRPWLHEPSLLPFPWRQEVDWLALNNRPNPVLRIGILRDDGVVRVHPPIKRALDQVAERLKSAGGFEVVEWAPLNHDKAWEILASLYFSDGGAEEAAAIDESGEPWRPLSNFIIRENEHCRNLSIGEVWRWTGAREQYRAAYAEKWNATADEHGQPVDVILCPVGPGAAPPLDCSRYWGYTAQWNLLDYPGVVFPVSLSAWTHAVIAKIDPQQIDKVDPEVDKVELSYTPRNARDEYNYHLYEPERYRDAPISLQLVARRYEDEKLLQALELIKAKVKLPFKPLY